jgi:glycosyltransferase involved in cell wall biosynthesis
MIGQKGVPATFGGIEHHVEELGSRLAARGHHVTVYCRRSYVTDGRTEFNGMRLRHLSTVGTKHLDAITHSAAATIAAMKEEEPYDVIHYHAEGPGMLAFVPRLASRAKAVVTIHGLDHERAKWGRGARAVLKAAGWLSARVPDATVTVSRDLTEFYARRYGCRAVYIPNGVSDGPSPGRDIAPFGLDDQRFVLFVGRLVPEKNPDDLIRAFRPVPGDVRLVIAGGDSFTTDYVDRLRKLAGGDERIVFTGYVFGDQLRSLYRKAAAFVLPSSLEGMPLTLFEAIASGAPVVVSDIPPHLEIVGQDGPGHRVFRTGDVEALRRALTAVLAQSAAERKGVATLREHVRREYSWGRAAEATEQLYLDLVGGRSFRPESDSTDASDVGPRSAA